MSEREQHRHSGACRIQHLPLDPGVRRGDGEHGYPMNTLTLLQQILEAVLLAG